MRIDTQKRDNVNHLTRRDIMICIGDENDRKQRKNVTLTKHLTPFRTSAIALAITILDVR